MVFTFTRNSNVKPLSSTTGVCHEEYLVSRKSPGCHAKRVWCLEVPCDQLVFPEWINYLLKVPMLLMNGRAFLHAVLQNHLFLSDIEAQLLWAAEENLLPAGVLQVLGQRRWQLAKPKRHLLQSHEETKEHTAGLCSSDLTGEASKALPGF